MMPFRMISRMMQICDDDDVVYSLMVQQVKNAAAAAENNYYSRLAFPVDIGRKPASPAHESWQFLRYGKSQLRTRRLMKRLI